jgi:hypothetical protein
MDAIKAGVEKVKESIQSKKVHEETEKAYDPTLKPSERMDAAFAADQARMKQQEHGNKAELHKAKHELS